MSTTGAHSQVTSHFAFGQSAVQALNKNDVQIGKAGPAGHAYHTEQQNAQASILAQQVTHQNHQPSHYVHQQQQPQQHQYFFQHAPQPQTQAYSYAPHMPYQQSFQQPVTPIQHIAPVAQITQKAQPAYVSSTIQPPHQHNVVFESSSPKPTVFYSTSGPEIASVNQNIAQLNAEPEHAPRQFSSPIIVGEIASTPAPTNYYVHDNDQFYHGSTPAPSRQFLEKFKGGFVTSTIAPTISQHGVSLDSGKILSITQRPVIYGSTVHPGVVIKSTHRDCDDHVEIQKPTLVEVQKSVNIKNILIEDRPKIKYEFGARIIPQEHQTHQTHQTHHHHIVEKPVYVEKQVPHYVEKHVDRPVYLTKTVEVPVEKIVEKKVHVDRPVYIDRPVSIQRLIYCFNIIRIFSKCNEKP